MTDQLVDTIQYAFQLSPSKLVRRTSRELAIHHGYVFQQGGAPPHFALHVRDNLDDCFPKRWVGRGEPTAWPPRSPDLKPMDFFYSGYIKDIVYSTPVADYGDFASENCSCLCNCHSRDVSKHMART